jgi:hypothetical protein
MEVSLFEVNKSGYRTTNLPFRTRGDNRNKRHFQKSTNRCWVGPENLPTREKGLQKETGG